MTDRIENVLASEGLFVNTTAGVSMWPMLRDRRDVIVIRPLRDGERLKIGDVPLYRDGDRYVLHRVVGVHDGWYAIRGDNCLPTERVPDDRILGVLCEFHRGARRVRVESRGYRMYWRFWLAVWPVRKLWKLVHGGLLGLRP